MPSFAPFQYYKELRRLRRFRGPFGTNAWEKTRPRCNFRCDSVRFRTIPYDSAWFRHLIPQCGAACRHVLPDRFAGRGLAQPTIPPPHRTNIKLDLPQPESDRCRSQVDICLGPTWPIKMNMHIVDQLFKNKLLTEHSTDSSNFKLKKSKWKRGQSRQ